MNERSRRSLSKRLAVLAGAALVIALTLPPSTASAQAQREDWESGKWQFGISLYAWLPEVGGKTEFPNGESGPGVSIDPRKLISGLNFVYMGTLEAENGRLGVFTDVIYMNISGSRSQTRELTIGGAPLPADVTADASLALKAWVWTLAFEYRAVSTPVFILNGLLGARLLDVTETVGYGLTRNVGQISVPGRSGALEDHETVWDGIVGVKGRFAFGKDHRWIVPFYLDVGNGQSDLTWQAAGGIGYNFRWGCIWAGWRHLDYELGSGSPIVRLNFSGPMLLAAYRW